MLQGQLVQRLATAVPTATWPAWTGKKHTYLQVTKQYAVRHSAALRSSIRTGTDPGGVKMTASLLSGWLCVWSHALLIAYFCSVGLGIQRHCIILSGLLLLSATTLSRGELPKPLPAAMLQLRVARAISQHQQLPHTSAWDTLCLSLRLLSTAAAANVSEVVQQQPQWAHSSLSCSQNFIAPSSAPQHSCSPISHAASSAFASTGHSKHRARVLDGKAVAAAWSSELQEQVQDISRVLNRRPGLAVVLVGNRPDSLIYVSRKQEACK